MRDEAARRGLQSSDAFVAFDMARCEQPIHVEFEQQVRRRPRAIAVRLPAGDVSYEALNDAANRAARALLAVVAAPTRPVALVQDQGYASILWTLAILKAGACYAPLDHRLPAPALRATVDHLEPDALIVAAPYRDECRMLVPGNLPVLGAETDCARFSSANLGRPVSAASAASVFSTSGTTGTPKGAAHSHRSVLHNIARYTNSLRFAPRDVLSLVQHPSFSGTVSSLFGALLNGAAIAPFDLQGEDLRTMSPWLKRTRVTVFHGVPSIFRQLSDPLDRFPDIRLIRLEGDRATGADLRHFRAHFRDDCTLVNGLGATECGLVRQFFIEQSSEPDAPGPLPVGYPVHDMDVRVVDAQGHQLPAGSTGEIEVESAFLAIGYWRAPELTERRFIAGSSGMRRYRTGDLGRMDDDGCLTLVGRVDHRLRIAGQSVDPSEIERCLVEADGIAQCVVRDFEDHTGERRLCAYLVAEGAAVATVPQLRRTLSERFARQPVPTSFVFMPAFPLTRDFKVDPARLPIPGRERPMLANDYVAPRTELERQLATVWSEVLGIDPVGVTDSFLDLGGDSLRAMEFANRLSERFGDSVTIASPFEHATIRALAMAMREVGVD